MEIFFYEFFFNTSIIIIFGLFCHANLHIHLIYYFVITDFYLFIYQYFRSYVLVSKKKKKKRRERERFQFKIQLLLFYIIKIEIKNFLSKRKR